MDEVPNQLINGLTVTKGGVSFTFSDPLQGLFYDSFGPGTVTYVQDPSIQGSNERFSVGFSVPVSFIQFGLAEDTFSPLSNASVLLNFTGGGSTTVPFSLPLVDPFAEGQFSWSGPEVSSITVTADPNAPLIAFDNLTVNTAAVPEPASGVPLGIAILGVAVGVARRRFRTPAAGPVRVR
jgi:hypothetical protein